MKPKLTEKEAAAIEALRAAIKALPRTLYFTADEDFGIEFWKRTEPGKAYVVAKKLMCKRAIVL